MPSNVPPLPGRCDGLRTSEHHDIFPFDTNIPFRSCQHRQPGCRVKRLSCRRESTVSTESLRDGDEMFDSNGEIAIAIQPFRVPAKSLLPLPPRTVNHPGSYEGCHCSYRNSQNSQKLYGPRFQSTILSQADSAGSIPGSRHQIRIKPIYLTRPCYAGCWLWTACMSAGLWRSEHATQCTERQPPGQTGVRLCSSCDGL